MNQKDLKNTAAENMPENFQEIVETCRQTFEGFFLFGTVNEKKGVSFCYASLQTETFASAIADLCRAHEPLFSMITDNLKSKTSRFADIGDMYEQQKKLFK